MQSGELLSDAVSSLRGRTVLVTGADGFIGSHLTEALVAQGASVRAFCLYNSQGLKGWLDDAPLEIRAAVDFRLGDVRDARFVEAACEGVDVIFHLAALIAIPYSYVAPQSYVETNVTGTLNVLEAARRHQCGRVVHTSTSEVYGTPETVPITEDHPLHAQSPYSASKIAADKLCDAYAASFELPVVIVRPFNTYGPRQSARAVVPTILSQLIAGRKQIKLGSLEPKRDLTFVEDTVSGMIAAGAGEGIDGKTIQLGSGRTESIGAILELAKKVCGTPDAEVETETVRLRPAASEVMVLQSDPTRARELLGWSAQLTLEEGLARTAEWMRENLDRYDPNHYAV